MNYKINSFKSRIPVNTVFRSLRIAAGMTTRELSVLMRCSNALITHYEMGNRVLPQERIGQLCKVFQITPLQLEEYLSGRLSMPVNYRDECLLLLSKMDPAKIQAVYGILLNMAS